jgi:tetratricopeptide (TPR) repeat protein
LLYELLTGQTPFDAKKLLQAGLDEIRRTIRQDEPARPSTCLSTMQGADLTAIAKHRKAEPPKLIHLVQGDLDWIVMKCLEKDRTRRYETANGLAADIQRHLNDEPVVARPPSRLYEFQKTVRRHKFGFAAGAAVITVLAAGLMVSTWMFFKEQQARQQAEAEKEIAKTEAAKATAISVFLEQALQSANPDQLKGSGYTVRQLLDDFSSGLENQFQSQPEVEAEVRVTLGRAYYRLGLPDKSQPQMERALILRRRIFGEHELVAATLVDYAWTSFEQDQYAKGESQSREALDIYRKCGTAGEPVITALWALEKLVAAQGRDTEVDAIAQEALAMAAKSPGIEYPETANILHALAEVKNRQGKHDEGASLASKAVAMHRRLQGADHPETAWALLSLGVALRGQGKLNESEAASRQALRIFRKSYPWGHKTVIAATVELRFALEAKGDNAAAEALELEILAGQRATLGNDSSAVAETLGRLANILQAQGKQAEAEQVLRDELTAYTKSGAVGSDAFAAVVRSLREVLKAGNKPAEVEKLYQEVIPAERAALGNDSSVVATALIGLADFLKSQNRIEEADQKYRESLDIMLKPHWEEHPSEMLPWVVPVLMETGNKQQASNVCTVMLDSTSTNAAWFSSVAWYLATAENPSNRDPALAVELAKRAVALDPLVGNSWSNLGTADYRAGDFKQAIADLEKAVQLENGGSSYDYFFQAMAEHQVGHADVALRYYAKAIKGMDTHAPQNPELLRFRAEAEALIEDQTNAPAVDVKAQAN